MSHDVSQSPPLAFSAQAMRTADAPISTLIAAAVADPTLISFAAGLVDPLTLPVEECAAITARIFADPAKARAALQYGTTLGLAPLRERLLQHLEKLECKSASAMSLTPGDILVSTGSQQALFLLGHVLLDPGDIVITANPSYFVYTGTLTSLGARVMSVGMDDEGMDVEAVDRLLESLERDGELARVKFIYCTSFFQNPTGLSLSLPRRRRLLEIVRAFSKSHRILILEDAAYRELRYDGEALPSIKSFDAENRYTILTQTFSKPLAPGLKTGYTAMPPDVVTPVLRQKGNHDFGSTNLAQHIVLEALLDGSYVRHLDVLRTTYRQKRDVLLAALDRHIPAGAAHWTHPHGGLYVWLTLHPSIDTSAGGPLFKRCLERGVLYVPGDYCFQGDEKRTVPRHHLRLCFGQVETSQIQPGIEKLAAALAETHSAIRNPQSTTAPIANRKSQIDNPLGVP